MHRRGQRFAWIARPPNRRVSLGPCLRAWICGSTLRALGRRFLVTSKCAHTSYYVRRSPFSPPARLLQLPESGEPTHEGGRLDLPDLRPDAACGGAGCRRRPPSSAREERASFRPDPQAGRGRRERAARRHGGAGPRPLDGEDPEGRRPQGARPRGRREGADDPRQGRPAAPTSDALDICGLPPDKAPPKVGYMPQRKSFDRDFPASPLEVVVTNLRGQWPLRITRQERDQALAMLERTGATKLANAQMRDLSRGRDPAGLPGARDDPRSWTAIEQPGGGRAKPGSTLASLGGSRTLKRMRGGWPASMAGTRFAM